jgi:lipoprotein-anchoring transpeptidase ErfK/SrfK
LALYAQGELQWVFPVSGGTAEKKTPLMSFKIQAKYQEHWSTIYDTWMPWALLMQRPYYIHGGALPGASDSAGCIRLFPRDAEKLYDLVEVGTPGQIIQTPKLELTYPAFFCR